MQTTVGEGVNAAALQRKHISAQQHESIITLYLSICPQFVNTHNKECAGYSRDTSQIWELTNTYQTIWIWISN